MRDNLPNMLRAAAKEWRKENKVVATGSTRYDAALEEAADAIEDLEFACNRYEKDYKDLCAYLPKWIPVTERLPETSTWVLTYRPTIEAIWPAFLTSAGDWIDEDGIPIEITHWMPLPEPPNEE